mgnify:FL=1
MKNYIIIGGGMSGLAAATVLKSMAAVSFTTWIYGFRTENGELKENGVPRHISVSGMRGIAKVLAQTLDMRTSTLTLSSPDLLYPQYGPFFSDIRFKRNNDRTTHLASNLASGTAVMRAIPHPRGRAVSRQPFGSI